MSYQSKYTGQEIDELLDKVNAGGGHITVLFEGNFTTQNSSFPLRDNIKNYDAIIVSPYIQGNAGPKIKNPMWILVKDINFTDYEEYCFYNDVSPKEPYWYSIRFGFESNGNTMLTGIIYKSTEFNSNTVGLGSVYGVKLGDNGSTPTGNIISFMGTKAPKGYLICDGAEYNIADYPKLASHFEEQFEDVGYFGGDGVNTFKVPDLRNEFLRGYGELSEDIGLHQDATQHAGIYVSNYGKTIYCPNYDYAKTGNTNATINMDSKITNADLGTDASKYQIAGQDGGYTSISGSQYATSVAKYTSRPTNVAVLYCIKY